MNQTLKKTMSNNPCKQRGMTMFSLMIVIGFLLFQLVMAMNIIPVYMTDSTVAGILENLPEDPKAKGISANEMKVLIMKRLRMNSIYEFDKDWIKVKKGRGVTLVTIEYEPRGALIGNLEFIVSFKHEATIASR